MTDRELLKSAAWAAGYRIVDSSARTSLRIEIDGGLKGGEYWNPLSVNGDALALAVALNFQITIALDGVHVEGLEKDGKLPYAYELKRDDPCGATRRAIVRAAAEMGSA